MSTSSTAFQHPCPVWQGASGTGSSRMSLPRLPFQVGLGVCTVPWAASVVQYGALCQ